jgi:hypothetical protein
MKKVKIKLADKYLSGIFDLTDKESVKIGKMVDSIIKKHCNKIKTGRKAKLK